jgi:cytochrome b
MKGPILVWDLPTRVFHWLLAPSFAGAWLTAESERYRDLHVMLGYTLLGLIGFRLVWGFAGSRYARFAAFVRGPAAVTEYLGSLLAGQPQHHVGHNPAGAAAIVLLLALGVAASVSGWAVYEDLGGEWLEEAHELSSNAMLALVLVHILAVLASGLLHGENLVRAMVTGRKQGEPEAGIRGARPLVALAVLVAVLGYWGLELGADPPTAGSGAAGVAALHAEPPTSRARGERDDD